jgi:hypothetical protein
VKRTVAAAIISVTLAVAALAPAFAVSPSQEECEAGGGTFTREKGEVTCSTNVGNSPNSQTVDEGGQGNLDNKETCSGPGNSTAKCP